MQTKGADLVMQDAGPGTGDSIESRQALRRARNLMAAATSLLLPVTLFVFAILGIVPLGVALAATAAVAAWIGLFFVFFRSGLNLRFADPSMTSEQILAGIVTVAVVAYVAEPARNMLLMYYGVALLFGAFRFGRKRMLVLAAVAIAAHGTALVTWHAINPSADVAPSLMAIAVLAIVLPWFAIMGGYVNNLRVRINDNQRRLKTALERIEEIAIRDELTGVYNRRFIVDALQREISRVLRQGGAFSICLLDIDHFKSINDSFGHAAGDAVLRRFAKVAGEALRGVDLLGRYGGEEFLVVLPAADAAGSKSFGERIRDKLEQCEWPELPAGRRVTLTAGVTSWKPGDAAAPMLARADSALYTGKNAGRNRVVYID